MKIRISKMSDKQKKLAKKYPRVKATPCSTVELAAKVEDALYELTLASLKQIGAEDKIDNLEIVIIEEVRAVMEQVRRKITDCMAPQYDTPKAEIVTINGKKYVEATILSKHDNKEYKGQAKLRGSRLHSAKTRAIQNALNKATEAKCGSKTTIKDV